MSISLINSNTKPNTADLNTIVNAINTGLTSASLASLGAVTVGGLLALSAATTISAAGTTRADATALTVQVNKLTTVAASTGVVLPTLVAGNIILIENGGANAVQVYAPGSATIDGTAGSTGVALTNAKRCLYICLATDVIISAQLGVVSA